MATANTKTASQADAAAESLRDVNEQILDFGRKTTATALDAYESTLKSVAEYQDKVAETSQIAWVSDLARAQAELTRGVAKVSRRRRAASSSNTAGFRRRDASASRRHRYAAVHAREHGLRRLPEHGRRPPGPGRAAHAGRRGRADVGRTTPSASGASPPACTPSGCAAATRSR